MNLHICSSSIRMRSPGSMLFAMGRPSTGSYEHCGSVGWLRGSSGDMPWHGERRVHSRVAHRRGHTDQRLPLPDAEGECSTTEPSSCGPT